MDYRQLSKVMGEINYPLQGIDDLMNQFLGEYVLLDRIHLRDQQSGMSQHILP